MKKNATYYSNKLKKPHSLMKVGMMLLVFMVTIGFSRAQQVATTGLMADAIGSSLTEKHLVYVELTPQNTDGSDTIDASFTLSQGEIAAWGDYSISVRFNNTGGVQIVDARNGGGFGIDTEIAWEFGKKIKCWLMVDVPALSYSIVLQPEDADMPVKVATNFMFRKQDITELARWSCVVNPNNSLNELLIENIAVGSYDDIMSAIKYPYDNVAQVIPGKIEAEYYDEGGEGLAYMDTETDPVKYGDLTFRPDDIVDVQSPAGGVTNVGWINGGEWLEYTVDVKAEGTYQLNANLNIHTLGGTLDLKVDGEAVGSYGGKTQAGDWATFTVDSLDVVPLTAGTHVLRVEFTDGVALNFDYLEFVPISFADGKVPYMAMAQSIPGKVEAEWYDHGGEGVGYHEEDENKSGDATYRPADGVDVQPQASGIVNVGWIGANEWLEYTVNVKADGDYQVNANLNIHTKGGTIDLAIDGTSIINSPGITETGGWADFNVDSLGVASLTAGEHVLRMTFGDGIKLNVDYIEFVPINVSGQMAYKGVPQTIPGRIEGEYYDEGGEGIGFHEMDDAKNPAGSVFRFPDGVDVGDNPGAQKTVGWIGDEEWLEYTVNVEKTKEYILAANLNIHTMGGELSLYVDDELFGTYTGKTEAGDWSTFTLDTLDKIKLEKGEHVLKVEFGNGIRMNLDYIGFIDPILRSNADLDSVKIGGELMAGLTAGVYSYDIEVEAGSAPPAVEAWPYETNAEIAIVDTATTVPSTAYISVYAANGVTRGLYAINFVEAVAAEPADITFIVDDSQGKTHTSFGIKGSWNTATGEYDAAWSDGAIHTQFVDDGTNGDATAGDNIWTLTLPLLSDGGANEWEWGVTDADGNWIDGNWKFSVADGTAQTLDAYVITGSAIEDIDSDLVIYPNPVKSVLTISSIEGLKSMKITDMVGKVITEGKLSSSSIDVSDLASGLYFLQLRTVSNEKLSMKFYKK